MPILKDKPATVDEAVRKLSPMVYKMAHKFSRNHKANDFDDLTQHGFEGVVEAFNRFDGSKGCAFSSYAYTWAMALMNTDRKKAYKVMNNTSAKPIEDSNVGSYTLPLDVLVDMNARMSRMDMTTRAIHVARQHGYTYDAIASVLTQHGHPATLHQVRRRHLEALQQ